MVAWQCYEINDVRSELSEFVRQQLHPVLKLLVCLLKISLSHTMKKWCSFVVLSRVNYGCTWNAGRDEVTIIFLFEI